ncbi:MULTISPECIES: AbrB/MazE/SpoVT family DNA-binding domain-containing protein [Halanaerobium]|jgi:bifunctional DNA-binding transcriptional regulator/antitoxin component of YhaV-PrlF toxin-antitoxin module|uniref:AbrB/MazE/SpoVT family DNA-binding domain-containing protein n=1 Tax=Halanaerobium TaxID=2330 RepID=UPI00088B16C0|nr:MULTISPECIES: AbrB/MazE/SpoVT family DNA-binding domain-containing protein [Halanaerobium]PUU87210.1 MAG: AbrB family transcriptional regulator [Halanaerobium sp.]SDH75435.1 hypothetical protein SAMN04515651_12614 [Halanaerobium congolense]
MSDKLVVKVDARGKITIPKEALKAGDILFINLSPSKIELTRAIEDPLVELAAYAEKEYKDGNTQNLRDFAEVEGINLDD